MLHPAAVTISCDSRANKASWAIFHWRPRLLVRRRQRYLCYSVYRWGCCLLHKPLDEHSPNTDYATEVYCACHLLILFLYQFDFWQHTESATGAEDYWGLIVYWQADGGHSRGTNYTGSTGGTNATTTASEVRVRADMITEGFSVGTWSQCLAPVSVVLFSSYLRWERSVRPEGAAGNTAAGPAHWALLLFRDLPGYSTFAVVSTSSMPCAQIVGPPPSCSGVSQETTPRT